MRRRLFAIRRIPRPLVGAIILVALVGVSLGAFAYFSLAAGGPFVHPRVATLVKRAPNVFRNAGGLIPQPAVPMDGTLGMSSNQGSPGNVVYLAATGYTPNELVQPIWNYGGTGAVIPQNSFYEFNPIATADSTGTIHTSFWVPEYAAGTYTVAAVGETSGVVRKASYTVVPEIDMGTYIGQPGTTMRFTGWGFGAAEAIKVYWNYTGSGTGTLIFQASTDHEGFFYNRTYTIPAGTTAGTYTVAAIGQTTGLIAKNLFTVGTLNPGELARVGDWTNFGFDQQNTRMNPYETTISPANVNTLAPKWKVPLPTGARVIASPVVDNGIVLIGSVGGTVSSYYASNGGLRWVFYAPGPVYGTPTIVGGIAYFGSVNIPGESRIGNYAFAITVATGQLVWDNYLPNGGEWVPPLVANGYAVFSSAGKEGVNGGESAYDALTGAPLWSFATPYGIWAPATLGPGGTDIFQPTGNPCYENSATPGDGCSGYLLDLDAATGAIKWSLHFPDLTGDDDVPTAPTYYNGELFVGVKNGIFYCLNASNGNIIWQYDTGQRGDNGIYSSSAMYNGLLYFGSGDSRVHAVSLSSGALQWYFAAKSLVTSSPIFANGVVYVGSEDHYLYALDPTTGALLWSYNTGAPVWSSPIVSHGVMYIADGAGNLYAFTPNGQ